MTPTFGRLGATLALCLLTAVPALCAAEPVGYVKTVKGEASTPLSVGDMINTGASGSLGLTLKDNTVMSFGPSTRFTLEDYLFAPAKGDLKLGGRIASGTMHYVSGAIAHLKPESVAFKTPTGIIGVRGTRFVVVVEE